MTRFSTRQDVLAEHSQSYGNSWKWLVNDSEYVFTNTKMLTISKSTTVNVAVYETFSNKIPSVINKYALSNSYPAQLSILIRLKLTINSIDSIWTFDITNLVNQNMQRIELFSLRSLDNKNRRLSELPLDTVIEISTLEHNFVVIARIDALKRANSSQLSVVIGKSDNISLEDTEVVDVLQTDPVCQVEF